MRLHGDDRVVFDDEDDVAPFALTPSSPLDHEEDAEAKRSLPLLQALVCIALAATGSGAAFVWRGDVGGALSALTSAPTPASAPLAQDALLKSIVEAQQNATAIDQRNQDLLQAQTAEIKRLSDAVSRLATQVDALNVRAAQAVVPPHTPKKPAPKAVAPKPAAPVPPTPEEKQ